MDTMNRQRPIVLIPGAMSTALSWRYQIDAFAKDREIFIPDQHYSLTSIKDMARDIVRRIPPTFDLVGWSMGGYVAFELYPLVLERVGKLVLINTTARPESEASLQRRAELLKSIEVEDLRTVCRRQLAHDVVNPSRLDANFKEAIITETVTLGKQTFRNQLHAMISRSDARLCLSKVTCEVLIIAGRRDAITPPECSEEMASLLPRAALRIFDEVGHCSPWEIPVEVNSLIRDFLG
jgi:pimeloyl-ACP methyl ester carboxylesterase